MHDPLETRLALIAKLGDPGEVDAWDEFVALYEPLIYGLARGKGLQDADARDVCQEVFGAVAGAVERWDPALGSFRAWLARITRNLAINFLQKAGRMPRGSGSSGVRWLLEARPAPDGAESALFERDYRRRLFDWAAAMVRGEFTPSTWRAFWATAVEGRPPAEVAAELGQSVGSVYIARSRVLDRLRRRIAKAEGAGEIAPREADDEGAG